MDIKVVDPAGKEIPKEKIRKEYEAPESTPVKEGEIELQQVGQLFDMKPTECQKFANKLNTLIDYAKTQSDDHSITGVKWAIRSLQGKLGTPPLGQSWIAYLTEYAHLKLESIERQKLINKYERN